MSPAIWMAAAEAAPLAQTGGMGDVLRALPAALARLGFRVRRFLPAYGRVDRAGFAREETPLAVPLGPARAPVRFLTRQEPAGFLTTLVECEELFAREEIYGPPDGEYPDNARRFALFCRAVVERARRGEDGPDVLHVHDWHAALAPLFVRFTGPWRKTPRTVLTVHNLGYQGKFPGEELDWLSLEEGAAAEVFTPQGIEDHGGISFLKAGLRWADRLTTVSPNHAKEIVTPEGGFGLHILLRERAGHLVGILNGADYELWNPATDPHLPRRYNAQTLEGKEDSARALRERLGLAPDGGVLGGSGSAARRPILGVVSRLVQQKGMDVVARAAPGLLEAGADLAVLGTGDPAIARALESHRHSFPGRAGVAIGYDEALSHLVVAGSDLLLVPSRYEPCGLVQMHALRYGTIPVVNRTGGLVDTVRDVDAHPGRGTGFAFEGLTAGDLVAAVRRGFALRRSDPAAWRSLQLRAMAEDFSWEKSAARYADLYRDLLR